MNCESARIEKERDLQAMRDADYLPVQTHPEPAMGFHEETVMHQQEDDEERVALLLDKSRLDGLLYLIIRFEDIGCGTSRLQKVKEFINGMNSEIKEKLNEVK